MSGPGGRRAGPRGPKGPPVGAIVTGMVVGQAKRGVQVELGSRELLLARARYGGAAHRIEEATYGDGLTVEVVADPTAPGGTALSRVGIERSVRQPRVIEGTLTRGDVGVVLAPTDGSAPFPVAVLDRLDPAALVGTSARWLVGAPYRDRRFIEPDADA